MIKDFKNVKEMIEGLSEDDKFRENALNEIESKTIAKFLFILRCEHNLTQKELANKTGCTQSRISKIESSYNDKITVKDLLDYGNALDLQLEIGYQNKNIKIADRIKYHALKIKDYLENLVNLIDGDKDLAKKIFEFHLETYANTTNFILKNIPDILKDIPDLYKNALEPSGKESIYLSAPPVDKLEKVKSNNSPA